MSVAPLPTSAPVANPNVNQAYNPEDPEQESFIQKMAQKFNKEKPSIADTDPHLRAARAEAEKRQTRHFWSSKPGSEIVLAERDREILTQVKRRAFYLDQGFVCCGVNVGLDGVLGLIPFIGDALGAALAVELVRTASRAELPTRILIMMYLNVVADFFLGIIPFLGDIIDFIFMANKKNAIILQEFLLTRRRDELVLEKGELPITGTTATGSSVPGAGPGKPLVNNSASTTNPITDVKGGPGSQAPLSSNPSYPLPVADRANPPHSTGASGMPQATNPLNQPHATNASYTPQGANPPNVV